MLTENDKIRLKRRYHLPNVCPQCHHTIHPTIKETVENMNFRNTIYCMLQCPNNKCGVCFVFEFQTKDSINDAVINYKPTRLIQESPVDINFSEEIQSISSEFCKIYSEAHYAEQLGLNNICGVGYRKALEFLIKDYLIMKKPELEKQIKSKPLNNCIQENVEHNNLKIVAERAAWLGNDETHYIRKFVDKDINDLRRFIKIAIAWIEDDYLTEQALKTMVKR